ncbi:MAG: polysaccharide biosynthesis tyrosine autokinase, partial [Fimbriimonadaceae bacterium]|nr:polysaccharide biosynthesis tyrosine autokinase [Fimbriimonadaceae bacterium]
TNIKNAQNETVGEVQAVQLDSSGQVRNLIVGVGGFLGLGERAVAVQPSAVMVADGGDTIRTTLTKDQLKAMPPTRTDRVQVSNRAQLEGERLQLTRLQQQRQQLLQRFKSDHPDVKEVDAAIAEQEKYMATLPQTVTEVTTRPNPDLDTQKEKVRMAAAAVEETKARVDRLATLFTEKSARTAALGETLVDTFTLERELAAAQESLTVSQRLRDQLRLLDNDIKSPVSLLNPQVLPQQTGPRWALSILLGAVLGVFIGLFAAIAREIFQDKVNYPAEAVGLAGADVLARIPVRPRNRPPLIDDPQTARAFEAYRLLRAGMVMKLQQAGDGAFLVTSTAKGEGKTVVAGNLGVAMALDGRTTCVVDCHLREPKLHRLFRVENDKGLADVLLDQVSLEAAILETSTPNLSILTAGTSLSNPTEALASPEMLTIVEQLRSLFDVVIFDAPDAYSVADTQELSRHVRNVLFVVELSGTNKTRMEQALTFLRQSTARILGMAINKDPQAKNRIG